METANDSIPPSPSQGEERAPDTASQAQKASQPEGGRKSASEEERIAEQAKRAEQPEPDAKSSAPQASGDSADLINNTGDDIAHGTDADAASG
jgi:hypothetical protein